MLGLSKNSLAVPGNTAQIFSSISPLNLFMHRQQTKSVRAIMLATNIYNLQHSSFSNVGFWFGHTSERTEIYQSLVRMIAWHIGQNVWGCGSEHV